MLQSPHSFFNSSNTPTSFLIQSLYFCFCLYLVSLPPNVHMTASFSSFRSLLKCHLSEELLLTTVIKNGTLTTSTQQTPFSFSLTSCAFFIFHMHLTISEIIFVLLLISCLYPYKLHEGKDFVLVTAVS